MHIGAFEKNRIQEDYSTKMLVPWKDARLTFLKAEVFSLLKGAIWQAKTTAFLLQL